jgi:hypothetical protein
VRDSSTAASPPEQPAGVMPLSATAATPDPLMSPRRGEDHPLTSPRSAHRWSRRHQIRNQVSADTGDNLINGCVFNSRLPGSCAIPWFSGGGLRVTDCKILGHDYALVVQQTNDGTTSDFLD